MAEMVLKALTVDNLFDCCEMLDAVGTDEILAAFDQKEIAALLQSGKTMNGIGVVIAMKICGIIIKKLPKARNEICKFLAGCVSWDDGSAVTVEQIHELRVTKLIQLIKDFCNQDDITDFFKEAAGFVGLDQTNSGNASGTDTATEQKDT